jgi:hypothetical protein
MHKPRMGWTAKGSSMRVRRAACMAVAAAAVLIVAPSPATAASPTKGATYRYGDFGERTMVELQVSRRGRSLAEVDLDLFMRCSNGVEELGSLLWLSGLESPSRVRIARDGRFSAVFAEPDFPNPFAVSEEYWLSGRFVRRGKAARLVVRTRHVGEGGTVCDTGDRRGTAKRVRPGTI